jgi:hypothetical protein
MEYVQLFIFCFSGGDDFDEVDEDENIDELDQQEVRLSLVVVHKFSKSSVNKLNWFLDNCL